MMSMELRVTEHFLFRAERPDIGMRAHAAVSAVADSVSEWRERSRQRRMLGRVDDRLLRDMGLSRSDVEPARSQWFWQA
jgi:uncharacterized protein YjiS (DUF1127 family)